MFMPSKKYDLEVPRELFELFKEYIETHKELGYSTVSQYLNELIRQKAHKILENSIYKNKKKKNS